MRNTRFEVNGVEIQLREYPNHGRAVLFLHFGSGNMMAWQRVIPFFQEDYRLVLIDLRGHGKSDSPLDGYHIDQMAADVAGVLAQLGLKRAHVVGSSLGAEVGLNLAANHPDLVESLVCEGALYSEFGPYGIHQGSAQTFKEVVEQKLNRIRETPEEFFDSVEDLLAAEKQAYEEYGWWNTYVEDMLRYAISETEDSKFVLTWRKWVHEDYTKHYMDYRFEDYYRRVVCPVLMLPAEDEWKDPWKKEAMLGLSRLVESCQVANIPGAVHAYGWLLDPQPMCQVVLDFLSQK